MMFQVAMLPAEAFNAVPETVKATSTWLHVLTIVIGCATLIIVVWVNKVAANSKALLAEQEKSAKAETATRKAERDKQVGELKSEINNVRKKAKGTGKSVDRLRKDYKEKDSETKKTIEHIDSRLRKIEDNLIQRHEFIGLCDKVNATNGAVDRIVAIMNERTKHEQHN